MCTILCMGSILCGTQTSSLMEYLPYSNDSLLTCSCEARSRVQSYLSHPLWTLLVGHSQVARDTCCFHFLRGAVGTPCALNQITLVLLNTGVMLHCIADICLFTFHLFTGSEPFFGLNITCLGIYLYCVIYCTGAFV